MKSSFCLAFILIFVSCGKLPEGKKISQKSLSLEALQSSGVNLGSGYMGSQKVVAVICSDQNPASNAQRLAQLQSFRAAYLKGSYVNFTITGIVITPAQMDTLLGQAISKLNLYLNYNQCPSNTLSSVPVY